MNIGGKKMVNDNICDYRSQSVSGGDILLNVKKIEANTTEIIISNVNYQRDRSNAIKYILLSSLLFGGSLALTNYLVLHITLIVFTSIRIYCFIRLVESEKLTVAKDFGIQMQTTCTLGRRNSLFIQFVHIHDVVITEVIQNLKVTFMLSFLTKESWYEKRPIIPIMNAINQRLNVLKIVYKIL